MKFNLHCKSCGEKFEPTKQEREMWEDGDSTLPNECNECFSMREDSAGEMYEHSDADPGL